MAPRALGVERRADLEGQAVITFPCHPLTKVPKLSGWQRLTAPVPISATEGVGLLTGKPNGLVVLDLDVKDGKDGARALAQKLGAQINGHAGLEAVRELVRLGHLPMTPMVLTRSGGVHVYFAHPGGVDVPNSAGTIAEGVDVRGDGGYVIAPPSEGYRPWIPDSTPLAPCPPWIPRAASKRSIPREPRIGERNTALFRVACSARARGLDVRAAVEEANERCIEPLGDDEIDRIVESAERYREGATNTDAGNARRLVGRHGEDLRHATGLGWLVWDGSRFRRDATGEIERRAKETARAIYVEASQVEDPDARKRLATWAHQSESAARLGAMIALARSEEGVAVDAASLDADPWALNCTNVTVDLRTGESRAQRRDELISRCTGVAYDASAACPTFDRFLARVLPDAELRRFLQRWAGYSLTASTREHALAFLVGLGANGKSVLTNALRSVAGEYACKAPAGLLLTARGERHPTETMTLFGARLALCSEVPLEATWNEALVKDLTSEDPITARYIRENNVTWTPTHKLWIAGNHRPRVIGRDEGIWRRLRVVPFDVVIPPEERDRELGRKLEAEREGILAWCVRGAVDWYAHGLGDPPAVTQATAAYKAEEDSLAPFFEERCEIGPALSCGARELYSAYQGWTLGAGERAMTQQKFGRALSDRGFPEGPRDPVTRRTTRLGIKVRT